MRPILATDWLARPLACLPYAIAYQPDPTPTAAEIEAATARLDALPRDEQLLTFCAAMGFPPLEYLSEQARYASEVMAEIDWLTLDGDA